MRRSEEKLDPGSSPIGANLTHLVLPGLTRDPASSDVGTPRMGTNFCQSVSLACLDNAEVSGTPGQARGDEMEGAARMSTLRMLCIKQAIRQGQCCAVARLLRAISTRIRDGPPNMSRWQQCTRADERNSCDGPRHAPSPQTTTRRCCHRRVA